MASEYSRAKRELLEKYLRGQMGAQRKVSTIPRREPGEAIPLTHGQEQIWVHAQLAPNLPIYNEPVTIHYSGSLNAEALERSFNEILRRHEAWRTSISIVDGEPIQIVHDSLSVPVPLVDLTHLPREQRDPAALQLAADDAREPLDLGQAPLFRAKLIRMDEREFRLHLTLCHIIFDGVALDRVFLPELAALYKAYAAGEPSPLPDPSIQYPDYACWEKKALTPEVMSKDVGYWRDKLSGHLPELYLPADHHAPRSRTFRGSMYRCKLRAPLMKRIREFCAREGVSPFHVTFAAFAALLQRYSGEERIPVGIVTAGRDRAETEAILGYFLNTVVIPADITGNPSFRALVRRVREWTIEAIEHGQTPLEYLIRELKVQRDPSRNPLFQALFSLERLPAIDTTWRLTQADVDTGSTKYDLYLKLDERADEIVARFHYSTDLFERESIARMAMHWKTLLRNAIASPDRRLSDVPLLNVRERRTLLSSYTGPTNYPKECIHELFEQQAERTPDAIAVVWDGQSISYRELNEHGNQVAHLLLQFGLPREALVGLSIERGPTMVAALLGILKAGAAYVPLDTRLPGERLSYLLADSKPAAIITDKRSSRPQFGPDAIVLDPTLRLVADENTANPRISITPDHLAYVLYTSGSTGKPKGVAVEHRSVVNLLSSMQQEPGITSSDVLLAVTTLSFDIAGLEIFLPLITGARLVLAGPDDVVDGTRLRQLLDESQATLMQATPASWRMLIEAGWPSSPNLKILCGGEALPTDLAKELLLRSPSVWNVYGPTETTIWSSIHRLNGQEDDLIPIGRPIANTSIYVVDNHGNLVSQNVTGEICIGGHGLARGYWNQPELTAQRFVPNWLAPEQCSHVYRTGDLGRWNTHGHLEYLGRIDTQIKLRGMRIELGEIESVLASHPHVSQAVVTVKGEAEQQKLAAFLVAKDADARLDTGDLRRHLRTKLPEHMLPAEYWQLETIPLLPSGKVNRTGLSRSGATALTEGETFLGPRNQTEILLATIWSELLKVRVVGIDQNFFDLGGHSLLVLQMVSRIRRLLEIELPARSIFEAPTIAALAQEIEKARTLGPTLRSHRATDQDANLNHLHQFREKTGPNLIDPTFDEKQASDRRVSRSE